MGVALALFGPSAATQGAFPLGAAQRPHAALATQDPRRLQAVPGEALRIAPAPHSWASSSGPLSTLWLWGTPSSFRFQTAPGWSTPACVAPPGIGGVQGTIPETSALPAPFVQDFWGPQEVGVPTAPRAGLEVQLEFLQALPALQPGEESYGVDPLRGPDGAFPGIGEFGISGRGEHRKLEGIRPLRHRQLLHPHLLIQGFLYLVR